ncbi:PREDICTED: transcription factor bHLH143-like isoform X2 [Populus euphratica]|uniref:Transcription factor bHLH143-like isoform X2 n=1 Tax=Populus euphratica TaxID=75702 RepID=A0AAJ6U577_POPEU|nr:PREDICTED: transcription factor bHLH143-like isoform X2 [Populus euphratica]XP_011023035.1 PREDICTED: transcription factor bHLH143-like isoform X2 [Populus euphratica]
MVCQAASQTRFRALKHENGSAGKLTIIVRVIACYQPLQDCQAEGSWLFPPLSTWQSPNFNRMTTSLDPAQLQCLPACMNPGTCMTSANMSMPGLAVPSIPNFETQQGNEAYGLPPCVPPHFQNFLPGTNPYVKENLSVFSYGLGRGVPNPIVGCQRRFFIFDQSGNEKRLMYSSFGLAVPKPTTADAKPIPGYLNYKEYASKMDQMKLKLHEVSDENHFNGEETEMHEDTEEINALLDSDGDDYDGGSNDDDSDDDEVRSTGHFPILIKSHGAQEQVEEITEEVTSSDGPNKRQKLIDGGYKKSSPVKTASSVKVEGFLGYDNGYDSDMESSYAVGQTQKEGLVSILGSKQFRKDKIHATLKILESIIPGAKNKEPLLVLDEAINYLKSLKLKAKTLGVNYH